MGSYDTTETQGKQNHILQTFRRKHRNPLENSEISTISDSNVAKTAVTQDISKKSDEANGSVDSGIADIYGSDLCDEGKEQFGNPNENSIMVLNESKHLESSKPLPDLETIPAQAIAEISKEVNENESPIEKVDVFVDTLKSFQYKKDNCNELKNTLEIDVKLPAARLITDFTVSQVSTESK